MRASYLALFCAAATCLAGCKDRSGDGRPSEAVAALAMRSNKEMILDAILREVLTNPDFKDDREFYGTPGDSRVALVSENDYGGVPWPKEYRPMLTGYTFLRVSEGARNRDDMRLLGIRIDKYFNDDLAHANLFSSPVAVSILNAGGDKNSDGVVIGACHYYYNPKKIADVWTLKFEGQDCQ